MKESLYNYYINEDKVVLLFNAFTNAYLMLKHQSFDMFQVSLRNLSELEKVNPKLYKTLADNGYIVPNDFDELNEYLNFRLNRKFTTNVYEVIINPTMDCNFKCWYCYESHEPKSTMSEETAESVIKHIKFRHKQEKFENLSLSFFGGEPLMRKRIIKKLVLDVKEYAKIEGITLTVSFTTNGALMNLSLLELLKDVRTNFQITIDGNEQVHNSIRYFKKTKKGTYFVILDKIRMIQDNLENCNIAVRINYNQETLKLLHKTIDDLDFVDRKKVRISMHRIWQVDPQEIVWEDILHFINYTKSRGFEVSFMDFQQSETACYADNYSEAVINYDGRVFKCTARDFKNIEADGVLKPSGQIMWNTPKLNTRLKAELPKMCLDCKFLPSCPGLCSQKIIEGNNNVQCMMDTKISIEDYIVYNFNEYGAKLVGKETSIV